MGLPSGGCRWRVMVTSLGGVNGGGSPGFVHLMARGMA